MQVRIIYVPHFNSSSSSSIGTTAHCGLCPVEKCPSIFSYLPPTLSIFSLPAREDLFLLPLSILYWVFPFFSSLPVLEWSFLGILSSSILSRWPKQLILCPFIHFTIFSPLLVSSCSRFVRLFHSPFSYLGPYILLNIFLSKIIRTQNRIHESKIQPDLVVVQFPSGRHL